MIININEDRKWQQQQGGAEGWKLEQTDAPIQINEMWRGSCGRRAAVVEQIFHRGAKIKRRAKIGVFASSLLLRQSQHKRLERS